MGKNTNKTKRGKGIVNTLINKLPFELHIPSYQYCGPGTKLKKRLQRNDPGINELDRACKAHDIAYSQTNDITERNRADNILASKAWQRFKSKDASLGERAAALGVSGIMKAKSTMGSGMKVSRKKQRKSTGKKKKKKKGSGMKISCKRRRKSIKKKGKKKRMTTTTTTTAVGSGMRFRKKKVSIPKAFRSAVKNAKNIIRTHKPKSLAGASQLALGAAKAAIKPLKIAKSNAINALPRIIPVPKIGGVIPLIPVFAGLSALGALMGGSAGIASAVVSANKAKKDYNELKRHNESMEAIALGKNVKTGTGLYLKPYKGGLGLYLTPYQSKNAY